jgi:hypothetical protein
MSVISMIIQKSCSVFKEKNSVLFVALFVVQDLSFTLCDLFLKFHFSVRSEQTLFRYNFSPVVDSSAQ